MREKISEFMSDIPCPGCKGKRLNPAALAVTVDEVNIVEANSWPVLKTLDWVKKIGGKKSRDRLYPELVAGGIAGRLIRSAGELVRRTHAFHLGAVRRLDIQLARAYEFAGRHFGGQNLYLDAMQTNARHALLLAGAGRGAHLRRTPPAAVAQ
jgi:hypothetical protein